MSKSDKLPAFQFYPGDWRKDLGVQSLGYFERGVWFELLCLMHESEQRGKLLLNGSPMTDDAISRVLGLDKQILTTTLTNLLTSGVAELEPSTGALVSRRMVRDEALRKIRTEAGKQGGNPRLLNQKAKQKPTTGDKQIPTPSSSSSFSSSESPIAQTAPAVVCAVVPLIDGTEYGVTEKQVEAWAQAYPAVQVPTELLRFKAWCEANPKRRKTRNGIAGAIVNWLGRTQDRGGSTPKGSNDGAHFSGSNTSPTHQRIERNKQAVADALARRGISPSLVAAGADGRALPAARLVGLDGGVHPRLRDAGGSLFADEGAGGSGRVARHAGGEVLPAAERNRGGD